MFGSFIVLLLRRIRAFYRYYKDVLVLLNAILETLLALALVVVFQSRGQYLSMNVV